MLVEGSVRTGMMENSPEAQDDRNHPKMPIVWVRERAFPETSRKQRVICSTIGASVDLKNEDLRRLFVNACYWGMRMEDEIPPVSKATTVGNYEPTMFGFGKYTKGVKPADHASVD